MYVVVLVVLVVISDVDDVLFVVDPDVEEDDSAVDESSQVSVDVLEVISVDAAEFPSVVTVVMYTSVVSGILVVLPDAVVAGVVSRRVVSYDGSSVMISVRVSVTYVEGKEVELIVAELVGLVATSVGSVVGPVVGLVIGLVGDTVKPVVK